jgi:hypothetical protein
MKHDVNIMTPVIILLCGREIIFGNTSSTSMYLVLRSPLVQCETRTLWLYVFLFEFVSNN